MTLWKAGGGRKWAGWGAQVSIGGASDRFEAHVIRRRNLLKNFSSRFEPFSSTPLKPSEALLKPPPSCQNPSSPWSPLQSPSQAPEALLKPPSSALEAPLKPFSSPLEAPLKPFSSPLQAPFEAFTFKSPSSPSQAALKLPWSPLEAPLKPPWSPLEALLKPPWSPLQALEGYTKVKPPSSPLQAPFKPPWEGLEAPPWSPPFKPPFKLLKVKGTVHFSLRILPGKSCSRCVDLKLGWHSTQPIASGRKHPALSPAECWPAKPLDPCYPYCKPQLTLHCIQVLPKQPSCLKIQAILPAHNKAVALRLWDLTPQPLSYPTRRTSRSSCLDSEDVTSCCSGFLSTPNLHTNPSASQDCIQDLNQSELSSK